MVARNEAIPETEMFGVREYAEEMPVSLVTMVDGRLAIEAKNEGGYNVTRVDVLDVIRWLKSKKPELLR